MTVSFYGVVSNVSVVKDFLVRRNIKKQVLFPRYQGIVGTRDTVCAYVGSEEINPASNLSIIDLSDSIPENSRTAFSGESQWQGTTWYSITKYFSLTDVVGDYKSPNPQPLYWKHVLPSSDIEPSSVAILDANMKEVAENSYRVVRIHEHDAATEEELDTYEDCSVYHNYINSYNHDTGELEIYYVRFEVDGSLHYQILNPESAFSEATLDDVSSVTGRLKYWRKVYIVSPGPSYFTITTPLTNVNYFLKPIERGRIFIRQPIESEDTSPWFVNISNGSFNIIKSGKTYSYSVPEFSSQSFSPLQPYKIEVDEPAQRLASDILKVERSPLKIDSSLYTMDIIIRDSDNNPLYALTTNTSVDGNPYFEGGERKYRDIGSEKEWISWDSEGIAGWDTNGGFIHLQREYPGTYSFDVTYHYEEGGLEFTSLNVNPVFDEGYNGQFHVVYVVPTGGDNGNTGLQTSSVNYIRVNRSGQIIETSQDGDGGNLDLDSILTVDGQYIHYSREWDSTATGSLNVAGRSLLNVVGQTSLNAVSLRSSLPPRGVLVIGLKYGVLDSTLGRRAFVIGYSSYTDYRLSEGTIRFSLARALPYDIPEGSTVQLLSFKSIFSSEGNNNYQWFILGEIHSKTSSRVGDLSLIDLRKRGSVVKEEYHDEAMSLDPRAIWARPETIQTRGQPSPGDSVAIVKVPYTLLKDYGGIFLPEEVEEIIRTRHLATGIIPVVIFHGAIPNITSVASTSTTITVCWDSEGDDYSYNVYYSILKDGPWTLAGSIDDQIYGNCYTISGLASGTKYFVSVSAVSSDEIESPKGTSWAIRTRT